MISLVKDILNKQIQKLTDYKYSIFFYLDNPLKKLLISEIIENVSIFILFLNFDTTIFIMLNCLSTWDYEFGIKYSIIMYDLKF